MNKYQNGILKTYENSSMSLSCCGEIEIKDGKVVNVYYKGMPRTGGRDSWFSFYENRKKGDKIETKKIEDILSYNGHDNVKSVFLDS